MRWWLVLGLCLLLMNSAKAVLMTLEQPGILAGGELTLLVETRTSRGTEPDLEWPAIWEEHFQLLDQEYQLQPLPRGDYQHRWVMTWQHQDAQSRSRELNLPPLRVNGRPAQRLRLRVTAAPQPSSPPPRRLTQPLEMEHEIERQEVYIGESLLYHLTIRYQGYPSEPRLSPLEVEGGNSRSLGDGREEGFNQRGVHWQEARWREVVHINQSKASIQPRYFSSRLGRPGQSRGERYQAEVPEIPLKVLPLPEAWPEEAPWLPALGLRLEAQWKGATRGRVQGEPIELEIHLLAVGQQARTLPRFQPESLPGFYVEPLSEQTRDQVIDGYLTGQLTQRLLVYPLEAGAFNLPSLQVSWWDIDNKRLQTETASLPQLTIATPSTRLDRPEDVASSPIEATPPPNWGRIVFWCLALLLVVFGLGVAWRIYLFQIPQQLKQRIQKGPETWSHSQLLALVREFNLHDQAQPLLIRAARGQPLVKKQLLAFWFDKQSAPQSSDLPAKLNPTSID